MAQSTNAITIYQDRHKSFSMPAARLMVCLDGKVCDFLEVTELESLGKGGRRRATLEFNNRQSGEGKGIAPEDVDFYAQAGMKVEILQPVYRSASVVTKMLPVFSGTIESVSLELSGKSQRVEVTARDFSAILEKRTVYGVREPDAQQGSRFRETYDTVFNHLAEPNRSEQKILHGGRECYAFASFGQQARNWTLAQMIHYLLCEYTRVDELVVPSLAELETLTGGVDAHKVNVSGLSVLKALEKCCERAGLHFRFCCRCQASGPAERIEFYIKGRGRRVEVNMADANHKPFADTFAAAKMSQFKNYFPVTNRYIGRGKPKIFEATFELVKAWDPSLEGADWSMYSWSTSTDFSTYRNVYRRWCLNESGIYTVSPYNRGSAYDLSHVFGTDDYFIRARRFLECVSRDSENVSLGLYVEASYDGGLTWHEYNHSFDNLVDQCGIWLSSDALSGDVINAVEDDLFCVRVTASIESDEIVWASFADGPVNSSAPVVDKIVRLDRDYCFRKVSPQSIFYKSGLSLLGQADEVDDTSVLTGYLRNYSRGHREAQGVARIQTLRPMININAGDLISIGADSRDYLGIKFEQQYDAVVTNVKSDLKRQQSSIEVEILKRAEYIA